MPSPQVGFSSSGAHFGLRWQLTPFLYAFGLYPEVSPVRVLVADPIARLAGSVEFFLSPEYLRAGDPGRSPWFLRGGMRAYFPVIHRGEYLAVSVGSSVDSFQSRLGASYELGAYVLFGILGLQATLSPGAPFPPLLTTFRVRFF